MNCWRGNIVKESCGVAKVNCVAHTNCTSDHNLSTQAFEFNHESKDIYEGHLIQNQLMFGHWPLAVKQRRGGLERYRPGCGEFSHHGEPSAKLDT